MFLRVRVCVMCYIWVAWSAKKSPIVEMGLIF